MAKSLSVDPNLLAQFNPWPSTESLFITFEGIDGAGKSTQIQKLAKDLTQKNFDVLQVREPGGTEFGEKLRAALKEEPTPLSPWAEAYLFASSRAQLADKKIIPHLQKKRSVVLCDRHLDSSLAYQGVGLGLGIENILQVHAKRPLNLVPHITFYIAITPEESRKRQQSRGEATDYIEEQDNQFFQNLYDGYEKLASLFPQRIRRLDGTLTPDQLYQQIDAECAKLL